MTIHLACWIALAAAMPFAQEEKAERASGEDVTPDESVYAEWELGPPTDSDWFPLGVWVQDPRLAARYARLGINTFVGLWKGPTEEQLAQLTAANMLAICSLNKVGLRHLEDPTIIAWMQIDEPDNRGESGPGPRATPAEVQARYDRIVARDSTRPVWMSLGQGVANDRWKGIGAKRSDYPAYVQAADIVSFDVYPVTNIQRDDGENYLWYVAKGVRRLRKWSRDERVIWNVIECTRVGGKTKKPTPAQMRSEVWMSLVSGSRGIVYFCHEFEPKVNPDALLEDREMSRAVAAVNAEIQRLAPVLNSATIAGRVTVKSSDADVVVGTMLKEHDGSTYLLTVGMRNAPTTADFKLEGVSATTATVLGEDRRVDVIDGRFSDSFEPYAVHVYRFLDGPPRPGVKVNDM